MNYKKENYLMLLTVFVLLVVAVFSFVNREPITRLFQQMLSGVPEVQEYVRSLGIIGVLAIALIIVVCFFFPVISSVPLQIASVVSYGLPFGFFHVLLSIFLASQLAFLFTRSVRIFLTPKQRKKQQELEAKIQNSHRSIIHFLLLAYLAPFVPFMLIHMIAAQSGMRWRTYALITLLGPIPDVFTTLWLGRKITTTTSPVLSYVMLLVIVVCVVVSLIYKEQVINWIFTPKKEERK